MLPSMLPRVVSSARNAVGQRWRDLAALGFLLLCTLYLFRDAIQSGLVYYEFDTRIYYYPVTAWADAAIDQGHIPLWSPYIYGGFPLFADGEAGVLYPLNLALLAILPAAQAFIWQGVLRYFLAGVFCYAFLRVLRLSPLPALVGGLTVAFGSFTIAQMHHVNVVNSSIWLPVVLLFVELALRAGGRRRVIYTLCGGAALAMPLLTVHLQPVLMTGITVALYILFRVFLFDLAHVFSRLIAGLLIGAGVLVVAAALSAVQLLPLAELAMNAARGDGATYEYSTSFAPAVPNLITLLFPYFFRSGGFEYWTLWFRWETTIYAGIAPLLAALIAVFLLRSRYAFFFAFLAVVSLLLALGDYSPLKLYWLLWQVPGFSYARAPGRFSMLFVLSVGVLAALGVGYLQSRLAAGTSVRRPGVLAVLAVGLASALGLVAALVAGRDWLLANKAEALVLISNAYLALRRQDIVQLSGERIYTSLLNTVNLANEQSALQIILLLASLLLIALWYRWRRQGWLWQPALAGLVAFDLLVFGTAFHPQVPIADLSSTSSLTQFLLLHGGMHRAYTPQPTAPTMPNRLLPFRVATVSGYSSLDSQRHRDYIRQVRQGNAGLLDIWNVRYVILPRSAPPPGAPDKYRAVFEDGDNVVYENAGYLPRAFLVRRAVKADSAGAAMRLITQREFNPRRLVVLERGEDEGAAIPASVPRVDPEAPLAEVPADDPGQTRIADYRSTEVSIEANASSETYLVFGDTFYPGWQATIDGRPAPIYRANYLFRAIVLPPGRHSVVFRYDPTSFKVGAAISTTSALLLLTALVGSHVLAHYRMRRRLLSRPVLRPEAAAN